MNHGAKTHDKKIALVDLDDCESLYSQEGDNLGNQKLHAHLGESNPDYVWTMTARTSIYLDFKLRSIATSKLTDDIVSITYLNQKNKAITIDVNKDTNLSDHPFQLTTAILDHVGYPWRTGLTTASMDRLEKSTGLSRETTKHGLPQVGFIGPRNAFFYCPIEEGFDSYAPSEQKMVDREYPGLHYLNATELWSCSQSTADHIKRMELRLSEKRSDNTHHQEVKKLLRQQRQWIEAQLASGTTRTAPTEAPSKKAIQARRQMLDHLIIGGLILDDNKYYSFIYVMLQLQLQLLEGKTPIERPATIKIAFYDDKTPNLNAFLRAVALFNREIFIPAGVTIEPQAYLVNKKTGDPTPYKPDPTVFVVDAKMANYASLNEKLRDQALYQKGKITSSVVFVGEPDPTTIAICSKYGTPYTIVSHPHQAAIVELSQSGQLNCPAGGKWQSVKMVSVSDPDSGFHRTINGINNCRCIEMGTDSLSSLADAVDATAPTDLIKAKAERDQRIVRSRTTTVIASALFAAAALLLGGGGPIMK